MPDGKPNLILFDCCKELIDCIKGLQHSATDPNDVSKEPHGITHGPDALRYFSQTYVIAAEKEREKREQDEPEEDRVVDYHTMMCGTGVSRGYIYA